MKTKKHKNLIIVSSLAIIACIFLVGFKFAYNLKDVEAGQETIENAVGTEAKFINEVKGLNAYSYTSEGKNFIVDKDSGLIMGYVNTTIDSKDLSDTISEQEATQIAYNEANNFVESYFDYEYEIIVEKFNDYFVYIYQLTDKGNKTGNNISVRMLADGTIYSLHIFNNEDVTIADNEVIISESEAINISYNAIIQKSKEICEEFNNAYKNNSQENMKEADDEPLYNDLGELVILEKIEFIPLEIYINDIDGYSFKIEKTVFKQKHRYNIEVWYFDTNLNLEYAGNYKYSFIVQMDANTGEIITIGYGVTYME